MLSVVLIDDEFFVRKALRQSDIWEKYGYEVVGEAEDGKEGFELIQALKPDLAMVDINMPYMDGLEMARLVRDEGIKTKMVIVTGYDKFEYAKIAVALGICQYLLKPIDESELTDTLIETKKTILVEASAMSELKKLEYKVKDSEEIEKERFLKRLTEHSSMIKAGNLAKLCERFELVIIGKQIQVVLVKIDDYKKKKWYDSDRELWKFALRNIIKECLENQYVCEYFYESEDSLCCLITGKDQVLNDEVASSLKKVQRMVANLLNFSVTVSLGERVGRLSDVEISYNQAKLSQGKSVIEGHGHIFEYTNDEKKDMVDSNHYVLTYHDKVLYLLRDRDIESAMSQIHDMMTYLVNQHTSLESFRMVIGQIASTIDEYSRTSIRNEAFGSEEYMRNILESSTINQAEQAVKIAIEHLILTEGDTEFDVTALLVNNIKAHIADNYSNPEYKIELLVDELKFNYHYMCKVFKQKTGVTIGEQINTTRMKNAKILIDKGYNSVELIAIEVGFTDSGYFGKKFKKYYNVTPKQMIKSKMIN